jgi:hypothetical protein
VVIAVHSNSYRLIRGRTLLAVIFDEVAYWRDDSSANPDEEVLRAVKPSLVRTGGMLVGISSPYRQAGLLHARFKDHFGVAGNDILVVKGGTRVFNPTISKRDIDKELLADPDGARADWLAEFRSDRAALLDPESQLYLEMLPVFNRGAVSIPDHPTLLRELRGLERRTHRSGRDTVDHGTRGSDDFANALAGAIYLAAMEIRRPKTRQGTIDADGFVHWISDEPRPQLRWATVSETDALEQKARGTW